MSSVSLTRGLLVRERVRLPLYGSASVGPRVALVLGAAGIRRVLACSSAWLSVGLGGVHRKEGAGKACRLVWLSACGCQRAKTGRHVIFGADRTNERYWRCPLLLARLQNFWERSFEPPARLQAS